MRSPPQSYPRWAVDKWRCHLTQPQCKWFLRAFTWMVTGSIPSAPYPRHLLLVYGRSWISILPCQCWCNYPILGHRSFVESRMTNDMKYVKCNSKQNVTCVSLFSSSQLVVHKKLPVKRAWVPLPRLNNSHPEEEELRSWLKDGVRRKELARLGFMK